MMSGNVTDLPKAYTTRAKRVEIAAVEEEPVEVHADAEPVGYTPAVIEVLPGCIEVVVPEESL
jgi:diacylglycerol kinase family enzyme